MSEPKGAPRWTEAQEQAIVARGANILVGAAAGSGKTATLVERVIRRLTDPTDPVDVDGLLVVTFTEAAAAEMRERIGHALQGALAADPTDGRLQRQLALLGRASISTLHSFCLSLIRGHFYRLGLDPAVAVLGEHEALLLRHEVLDELFARRFEADQADGADSFHALVDRYGGGREGEGLKALVLSLYDFMQSLPWPEGWLAESLARLVPAEGVTIESLPWWPPLRRQIRLELQRAARSLADAERLCRLPGGPAEYATLLARERVAVEQALTAAGWEAIAAAHGAVTFDRLPAIKKGSVDEALQERVKGLRDEAKRLLRALGESYFHRSAADWLADLTAIAPHLATLGAVVQEFGDAFRAAKSAQSGIDFNDLERLALQLLTDPAAPPGQFTPSDVARELRGRYAEVLVDEYQDINGVQDAILTLAARDGSDGPPNRFMVGDVKQSIYRFRHADPSLFLAKYQGYTDWTGSADAGGGGGRIILGANFRSRAGVVDGVNFLFRQLLTAAVGEIDYDRAAELVCRAGYPPLPGQGEAADPAGPPVELHLLDRQESAGVDAGGEGEDSAGADAAGIDPPDPAAAELADLSTVEREARLIARRIQALVGGPGQEGLLVWDKGGGGYRPVRYRDIVILMRSPAGRANLYLDALAAAGIPAYAQLSTGYFAATEVEIALALLQVLDNPRQDLPLAAVLRSPIIGLSNADLARIRLFSRQGTFYEALRTAAGSAEALAEAAITGDGTPLAGVDLVRTLARFMASLERWRTLARRRPLSQVLWLIYQETGFLHYVAGMPGGAQRQANLLALHDRARQFDQFARQGLFRFLRFIERLREEQADMGAAPAIGEGEDVVRLMSIHKSKGLEFPVVFVTGLGSPFARQDGQGDLLLQRQLGLGPLVVDPEARIKYPSLPYLAIREAARLDALAEELRVLYVALTRARERLILVGSSRDLPARCERWATAAGLTGWPLPETLLATAESYLDWIGPALLRHREGEPLRALAGLGAPADERVAADPSRWVIQRWEPAAQQALFAPAAEAAAAHTLDWRRIGAAEPLAMPVDPAVGEALAGRFDWQYPYSPLVRRFGKLTVTELKGSIDPDPESPAEPLPRQRSGSLARSPRFLQDGDRRLSPTEYGTLVHLALQHLDLTRPLDAADLTSQVADLVAAERLTPEQGRALDLAPIARFFASPLGVRIRQGAARVRREVSFTLALPAVEAYPELDPELAAGESVIVQGMIDLLLDEGESFVLVDYKTDYRLPAEALKRYGTQVMIYRRAVEAILGRPVSEAYLHFLSTDQTVRV